MFCANNVSEKVPGFRFLLISNATSVLPPDGIDPESTFAVNHAGSEIRLKVSFSKPSLRSAAEIVGSLFL